MKFKNTKVRISTQVVNIGQVEKWHVIETEVEHEEGDTFESVLDAAFEKVNAGHEKHSQSMVDSQVAPKMKHDNLVRDAEITNRFNEVKAKIVAAKTKEAAGQILLDSEFKLNVELKNLVNEKNK